MSSGSLALLVFGLPLFLIATCAAALAPVRNRPWRMAMLSALMALCVGLALWWREPGSGIGSAFPVAPALLIAFVRLLLDVFSLIAERQAPGES